MATQPQVPSISRRHPGRQLRHRQINAYEATSGEFRGQVRNTDGDPLTIPGLWGLRFPTTSLNVTDPNALYFTAGINKEADGLFGTLTPSPQKDTEK